MARLDPDGTATTDEEERQKEEERNPLKKLVQEQKAATQEKLGREMILDEREKELEKREKSLEKPVVYKIMQAARKPKPKLSMSQSLFRSIKPRYDYRTPKRDRMAVLRLKSMLERKRFQNQIEKLKLKQQIQSLRIKGKLPMPVTMMPPKLPERYFATNAVNADVDSAFNADIWHVGSLWGEENYFGGENYYNEDFIGNEFDNDQLDHLGISKSRGRHSPLLY